MNTGEPDEPAIDAEATDERFLVTYLADRDAACPRCDYNLRSLSTARCPECGLPLSLVIGTLEPLQAWWVTLLISTGLVAGFGALCLVVTAAEGLPGGRGALEWVIIANIVGILLPVPVLMKRRRFLRLPRTTQAAIALIACFTFGTDLVLFFLALLGWSTRSTAAGVG